MPKGILAIDPAAAKPQACAWTEDGRRYHVESVDLADVRSLLIRLKNHVSDCWIESGFVGVNKRTSLALEGIRGEIKAHAESLNYTVHKVDWMTWATGCLPKRGDRVPINMVSKPERMRRAKWYARSLQTGRMREKFPYDDPLTDDEACALCMCAWARKQRAVGAI